MCGIVGILGKHESAPILLDGLKRLEYRGYDSSGIATLNNGTLERRRATGKLVNLSDLLVHQPLVGKSGIGHTRWATHGAPSTTNAHPHCAGRVAVVHNGIIENFQELRSKLAENGIGFETETDTETVALMAQHYIDQGESARDAIFKTIKQLEGAFALAFLVEGEDDLMIAARNGPPLAVGHGDGEMFIGSDALALSPMTNKITYLEDGDITVLTRNSVEIYDGNGNLANRAIQTVEIDAAPIDKAGYKHFMAKEIAQQPATLHDAISAYLNAENSDIILPDTNIDLSKIERLTMVACGTAYYACLTAKYWFERIARIPVEIDIASEFRYREPPIDAGNAAVFVSQSGETADTLAALKYASAQGAPIISIVNVVESSIARESDLVLPIHAGREIGVASTKAFTAQLCVMALLAVKCAHAKGHLNDAEMQSHIDQMRSVPSLVNRTLGLDAQIEASAKKLNDVTNALFLGRGLMFPIALEGALKLKEISYIHAEGYAAGELKHGPIALVDDNMPIVVLAPQDDLFEKTVSNMQEVMARSGRVIFVSCDQGIEDAGKDTWQNITMPPVPDFISPIIYAVPMQLLSYHAAIVKGTDVDQPRNLAKSVTVE